jgi:integrase
MSTHPAVVEYHGRAITRIGRTVSKAAEAAGIEHCSPHDLRRTAGSRMLQRGVKIAVVSRVLGHKSIRTTERVYAFLGVEDLRDAVAMLNRKKSAG